MAGFRNTIDALGDDAVVDSILCRTIESYADDAITSIGSYAFYGCSNLVTVDLPSVTSMGARAFYNCSSLATLILRKADTICALGNAAPFNGTPIKSGNGYIYVPRALLSDDDATKDYRRATNWSIVANQFRALEDYTVDGTITGELDATKI